MLVEVYTKPACPLCAEALELIESVQSTHTFTLTVHNIMERDEWFARYRYRVPVVCIDGKETLDLRFSEEALTSALVTAER